MKRLHSSVTALISMIAITTATATPAGAEPGSHGKTTTHSCTTQPTTKYKWVYMTKPGQKVTVRNPGKLTKVQIPAGASRSFSTLGDWAAPHPNRSPTACAMLSANAANVEMYWIHTTTWAMNVQGAGGAGSPIILWNGWLGSANSEWIATPRTAYNGLFGYEIAAVYNPSLCLDDPGFSTTNGRQMDVWSCNGGDNQTWVFSGSPVAANAYEISSANAFPNHCLNAAGGARQGAWVIYWSCDISPNTQWDVTGPVT